MYREVYKKDDLELDSSASSEISGSSNKMSLRNKSKSSIQSLMDYINERRLERGNNTLTHQWWNNINNINFKIKDEEYDEFVDIYARELKKKKILHVMEQPKEIGPLCLDFDLKQISPERILCLDNITDVIIIINNLVTQYYSIKNDSTLNSYVFMKSEPFYNTEKKLYSDGFHLQYPNLILNVQDRLLIYNETRKEIIKQDLFSNVYSVLANLKKSDGLNRSNRSNRSNEQTSDDEDELTSSDISDEDYEKIYNLTNDEKESIYNEIVDPCIIYKNKWFMYGSGKLINGDTNLYELEYIFDYNLGEIEDIPSKKELVKLLSIRKSYPEQNVTQYASNNNTEKYKKLLVEATSKYMKKSEKFDISKVLSFGGTSLYDNQDRIKLNTADKISKLTGCGGSDGSTGSHGFNSGYNFGESKQDDIILAKKLVKLLSPKRAHSYAEWISVGWALFNISPTLLQDFLDFSKLDKKKYDEQGCIKVWNDCSKRYDNSGYSIPSLIKWTKEDNMDGYKKILREKINILLTKGDIKTDFDVATIIYEMYKYDYRCSSISKGVWWEFKDHRWNRIDCAYSLSLKMSTDIAFEFAQLHRDLLGLHINEVGKKADELQKSLKEIQNLMFNLKKGPYKERIIKECALLFLENDFESKLDQNNYLVGFTNGVYDLRRGIFRKGSSEDMIGKSVGYAYKEFSKDDNVIKEIETFIENIQPDKDMRDYLMAYCASFLEGSNKDQKFMIWTGKGKNGKGTLIDLLDNTFGGKTDGYFGTLPPTILTQKRGSSSAATPELADKFGKRIIVLQEPEGDDKINVGFMKNITGQDKIEARPLYGDPFQYTPLFKLLLACNHLPNIPSDDGGTWRRIRVIDFLVIFVDDPKGKYERKSDPDLREKLKFWVQGFMWMLLKVYYPMYAENRGLDKLEPDRVKLATNKYKTDSNVFMEFFNEQLEKSDNSSLLMVDVYDTFKAWYTNSYDKKQQNIPRKKLIEYFESCGFTYNNRNGYIEGIRQKDPSHADPSELDANLN